MKDWREARRVLCIRLDAMGDVLMTTPAIRALKQSFAGRTITLLTSPQGLEVARMVPEIDRVITYQAPWMKSSPAREDSAPDLAMVELLERECLDAAAIFTVYSQNPLPAAMLAYLSNIPLRLAHCRENPYHLLTHHVLEPEPHATVRHEVQRQLDLVSHVGCNTSNTHLSFRVPPGARDEVSMLLGVMGLQGAFTVIHPGATALSRRYRAQGFVDIVRTLLNQDRHRIVFTGNESEVPLVESIRAEVSGQTHSLAGRLNLPQMAALLESAQLVITNNTGPSHLAAAVGTPVVTLYALTNPQHAPWTSRSRVLFHPVDCAPCYKSTCPMGHHQCLEMVPPSAVVQAARELLGTCTRPISQETRQAIPLHPGARPPPSRI